MNPSVATLHNRLYFPAFSELPHVDEVDGNYYQENANGMLLPSRTWTFAGEIVNDSLSQLPTLGHRVEVKDMSGQVHSILFYPEAGMDGFDFAQLKLGHSIFIRYAHRCYFSDLSTEAIKVEDLNLVKVIETNLDTLLYVSHVTSEQYSMCAACQQDVSSLGGSVVKCDYCQSATYCSQHCRQTHLAYHQPFCFLCQELQEIFNIDFERFTQLVPFR